MVRCCVPLLSERLTNVLPGRSRVRPTVKTPKVKSKFKGALGSPASSSPAGNVKRSSRVPPSSLVFSSQVSGSAKKRNAAFDDLFSEEGSEDDDVVELPVRETKLSKTLVASGSSPDGGLPVKGERKGKNGDTSVEEEDDKPLVSATPRHKRRIIADDSDDEPLVSSPVKRRRLVRRNTVSSPAVEGQHDTDGDDEPAPSSARASRTRRKPLTQKEKARELLRRKRAGETIVEEEEPSSSQDELPARAIYDTDSDHLALVEFEDEEEEGVPDSMRAKKKGKKPKKDKKKKKKAADDGDSDSSMDDFVVDDSDAPLGAPDDIYSGIPLQFTSHSHKPLKEHFRDAIEWLVQFKINPGFSEKEHPLYRMAWKKLDDEVRGLATSKFASAAWKKDFYMALRARPYLDDGELPKGSMLDIENCGACGRSGHPAK